MMLHHNSQKFYWLPQDMGCRTTSDYRRTHSDYPVRSCRCSPSEKALCVPIKARRVATALITRQNIPIFIYITLCWTTPPDKPSPEDRTLSVAAAEGTLLLSSKSSHSKPKSFVYSTNYVSARRCLAADRQLHPTSSPGCQFDL